MYQSTYLTVRVHNADDAAAVQPEETVDHMLWLLDVYDTQVGCSTAVKKLLMSTYHKEQNRVPGILPRWTKSMLTWVTYLHSLDPDPDPDPLDPDPDWGFPVCTKGDWGPNDVLVALDALAMHWREHGRDVDPRYLHMIWMKCKTLVMHQHPLPSEIFEKSDDMYTIQPVFVMAMLSRFYWFNQTLLQLRWFPSRSIHCPAHRFDRFIDGERRHLKIARFREGLTTLVWDRILFYGDREIAVHSQLGDTISAYSCLYKRRPICLMQKYQRVLSYGSYDEICQQFADVLWLYMIRAHFINNYQIDFIKYFVCWECDQHKHLQALKSLTCPVILERFGKYTVLHNGHTYLDGSVKDVFPLWVHLAKLPHGRQLHLKQTLFKSQ